MRWTPKRKQEIVEKVLSLPSMKLTIISKYNVSEEEFDSWLRLFDSHGLKGLRSTRFQAYRSLPNPYSRY